MKFPIKATKGDLGYYSSKKLDDIYEVMCSTLFPTETQNLSPHRVRHKPIMQIIKVFNEFEEKLDEIIDKYGDEK
tara:strand:- start:387 stop:611 length:225 start_codon:yes stop_codon:yes gene_type:complete